MNYLIAYIEDGRVFIYQDTSKAIDDWCFVDVQGNVVSFFDDDGIYLKPVKKDRTYELVAAPGEQPDSLDYLLEFEFSGLVPNPWFQNVAELRKYLLGRKPA